VSVNYVDHVCVYCGVIADTVDHVVPKWLLNRAEGMNLDLSKLFRLKRWEVPACRECNSSLGNRIFPTLAERRKAVKQGIRRRYRKILRVPNWTEEELAEMGPNAQREIRRAIAQRDWVRERLAWKGATVVDDIRPVFDLVKTAIVLGEAPADVEVA
jgi:hypothetical protein